MNNNPFPGVQYSPAPLPWRSEHDWVRLHTAEGMQLRSVVRTNSCQAQGKTGEVGPPQADVPTSLTRIRAAHSKGLALRVWRLPPPIPNPSSSLVHSSSSVDDSVVTPNKKASKAKARKQSPKPLLWIMSCFFGIAFSFNANAGIPVIDGGNLTQNMLTAFESVTQTLKQIEQYQTQLQQYENMLQNTAAPSAYIWDQAIQTMSKLRGSIDTLEHYKRSLGSIDGYLGKFQDVAYYRASPCFSSTGCSTAEWLAMDGHHRLASESQKKANDAMLRSLDQQHAALQTDAVTLQQLQHNAQSATGQMQALAYANQLASQQANQLLQIRALLVAQQNAAGALLQSDADLEARHSAAHDASTENRISPTTSPKNWLEMNR